MYKINGEFKLGKLIKLQNQSFEINEATLNNTENVLNFYIYGMDKEENEYSLDFTSLISRQKIIDFELYEHIDFFKYIDQGDIVFGYNGVFEIEDEILKMDMMKYLPNNKFLLNVIIKTEDEFILNIEIDFEL